MTAITSLNILDQLETKLAQSYEPGSEQYELGLVYAEEFLNEFTAEAGADSDQIQQSDYLSYRDAVCEDVQAGNYYFGDEYQSEDLDLFLDVRDQLDSIIQSELDGNDSKDLSLWGECPSSFFDQPQKITTTTTAQTETAIQTEPATKTKETKKSKPSSVLFAIMGHIHTQEINRINQRPKVKVNGWAYCANLGVIPGGATLIYSGEGFVCEFNYSDSILNHTKFYDEDGQVIARPPVYSFYPKTMEAGGGTMVEVLDDKPDFVTIENKQPDIKPQTVDYDLVNELLAGEGVELLEPPKAAGKM